MTDKPNLGPRERLLAAAEQLTYAEGLHVGVDALLRDANVARRSLYEHFGGKDGLYTALLDAGCPRLTLVNRTPSRAEALAK